MTRWPDRLRDIVLRAAGSPPIRATEPLLDAQRGWPLARTHLRNAIAALVDAGDSQVEAFRKIRLELNRLEQGGLGDETVRPEPARLVEGRSPTAPVPLLLGQVADRARALVERVMHS